MSIEAFQSQFLKIAKSWILIALWALIGLASYVLIGLIIRFSPMTSITCTNSTLNKICKTEVEKIKLNSSKITD
jgi:hypothetical protein